MKLIKNYNTQRGLTLIELMVSLGIFAIVIGLISGILVLALISQRRLIALQNAGDNARFAIESMAREIRTSSNFSGGGSSLSFINSSGQPVVYRLNNNIVEKSSDGGVTFAAVTGTEVKIDYLNFYLSGQAIGDGLQPRITIDISVTGQYGNQSASLKLQTTVSERILQS